MKTATTIFLALLLSATGAWGGSVGDAVEVRIVTDDGRTLPTYPVKMKQAMKKVYAEAAKGDHYRIAVTNRLNRRVGLVIAVDGRNIISGEKSWLKNNERMYILEPYETDEFAGWRTGEERINRFYFTDVPDSYAAAFGDESAMGIVSVAVYPEARSCRQPIKERRRMAPSMGGPYGGRSGKDAESIGSSAPAPAAGEMMRDLAKGEASMESAGTGYGREEYSLVRTVAFTAEKRAVETIHFKYEWRSTLCRLGVVNCERSRPANRLWDNGGFAPPPPGRS